LVVKTDTPARIRIHVWGDGYSDFQESAPGQYEFAALFDDLQAGTTYSAKAYAWDGAGELQMADGAFTTLNRHVEVKLPIVNLVSTYLSNDTFSVKHWANGAYMNTFGVAEVEKLGQFLFLGTSTTGTGPQFSMAKVGRDFDLRVVVYESNSQGKVCEAWPTPEEPTYPSYDECGASAVARPAAPGNLIDLDSPVLASSWLEHTIHATLSVDYGQPFPSSLNFTVPATILVTYS
jgi:hypothetical protein